MYTINKVDDLPWLVVGDLNEVIQRNEKDGGNGWSPSRRRYLVLFMGLMCLMDLEFHG